MQVQSDGHSCGVWVMLVCYFATLLGVERASGIPALFQSVIESVRQLTALCLLSNNIMPLELVEHSCCCIVLSRFVGIACSLGSRAAIGERAVWIEFASLTQYWRYLLRGMFCDYWEHSELNIVLRTEFIGAVFVVLWTVGV